VVRTIVCLLSHTGHWLQCRFTLRACVCVVCVVTEHPYFVRWRRFTYNVWQWYHIFIYIIPWDLFHVVWPLPIRLPLNEHVYLFRRPLTSCDCVCRRMASRTSSTSVRLVLSRPSSPIRTSFVSRSTTAIRIDCCHSSAMLSSSSASVCALYCAVYRFISLRFYLIIIIIFNIIYPFLHWHTLPCLIVKVERPSAPWLHYWHCEPISNHSARSSLTVTHPNTNRGPLSNYLCSVFAFYNNNSCFEADIKSLVIWIINLVYGSMFPSVHITQSVSVGFCKFVINLNDYKRVLNVSRTLQRRYNRSWWTVNWFRNYWRVILRLLMLMTRWAGCVQRAVFIKSICNSEFHNGSQLVVLMPAYCE